MYRNVIAKAIADSPGEESDDRANYIVERLVAAPDSVRQELAALLSPHPQCPECYARQREEEERVFALFWEDKT
jgi:hypothetical protein